MKRRMKINFSLLLHVYRWIVLGLLCGCTFSSTNALASDVAFKDLHVKWLESVLAHEPTADPRSDTDQLRPLNVNDGELILEQDLDQAGQGWQLGGGLIDVVERGSIKYLLYGRTSQFFDAGTLNNAPDSSRTLREFILVRKTPQEKQILEVSEPNKSVSQILLGLRETDDAFEVIQHLPSGECAVIWSSTLK